MGRYSVQLQIDTAVPPPMDGKIASVFSLSEAVGEVFEAGMLKFSENATELLQ